MISSVFVSFCRNECDCTKSIDCVNTDSKDYFEVFLNRRNSADLDNAFSIVFAAFSALLRYETNSAESFVEYAIFGVSPIGFLPAPTRFPPRIVFSNVVYNVPYRISLYDFITPESRILRKIANMRKRVSDREQHEKRMTELREMSLKDAKREIYQAVYEATRIIEYLEGLGKCRGNGHHARQALAQHAADELEKRWKDTPSA